MFLCEILTEQQVLPQPPPPVEQPQETDEYNPELDDESVEPVQEEPFQEILPIKRFYLIQRLRDLKTKLTQNNIQDPDFDIIIKFMNNISYNSLLSLAKGIIPVIEDKIARLAKNDESR